MQQNNSKCDIILYIIRKKEVIVFGAKQHLSFYIYSYILFFWQDIINFNMGEWELFFFLGGFIGCLLPDIDHPNSILGYLIPAHIFLRHGTATHTILAGCWVLAIAWVSKQPSVFGAGFGYMTHLFSDNIQGNNLKYLYYPIKRKKHRKKRKK